MIAKITLGKGFRGTLNYLMQQKEQGQKQRQEEERGQEQGWEREQILEQERAQERIAANETGKREREAERARDEEREQEGQERRTEKRGERVERKAEGRSIEQALEREADGPAYAEGARHRIIGGNMSGQNARELAREFGAVRQLRPDIEKAVHHASLTAARGERLTVEQWQQITAKYAERMGFANCPYVVIQHRDTALDHVHILASRISLDGRVVNEWQNKPRSEKLMREVEREYGLQRVTPSREIARAAPTWTEIERFNRTGELSTKMRLQGHVEVALRDGPTVTEFIERLQCVGVEVIPNLQSTGRVSGVSFRLEEELMKGSNLGRGFSWKGLLERGLGYEVERDAAALLAAKERAEMGRQRGAEMAVEERAPALDERRDLGAGWQEPGRTLGEGEAERLKGASELERQTQSYQRLGELLGERAEVGREQLPREAVEELQRSAGQRSQELDPLETLRRAVGIEHEQKEHDPLKRLERSVGVDREQEEREALERAGREPGRELGQTAGREALTPAAAEKGIEREVEREVIERGIEIGFGF